MSSPEHQRKKKKKKKEKKSRRSDRDESRRSRDRTSRRSRSRSSDRTRRRDVDRAGSSDRRRERREREMTSKDNDNSEYRNKESRPERKSRKEPEEETRRGSYDAKRQNRNSSRNDAERYERRQSPKRRSSHHDHDDDHDDEEDEEEEEPEEDDGDFDFTRFRSSLNRLFFSREEDVLQRNSRQCDDFWEFLKRFQAAKRRKGTTSATKRKVAELGKFSLPTPYHTKYRVPFRITNKEVDFYIERGKSLENGCGAKRIAQFRDIVQFYLDFSQRQKFAKLQKIKKDQQALPIYPHREKLLATIRDNQVVVIAADTGAGKSTQLPQYLMEAGYENIACTQPRRIACISLSKRVAHETLNEFGTKVGYQVRFDKSKTGATKILFLTEGLLLRQLSVDQLLPQYNVVVIDEVHERHVHTDFLVGVLKCLVRHRKDLKVILMSATINIKLFGEFFDSCPVVQVPGRLYPIEMEYCPVSREDETGKTERLNPRPYIRIMQRIDHKYPVTERGDLLIFSSGMSEIMAIADAARAYALKTSRWIVLPLHSTLSSEDQDKVFDIAPEGTRKCIIATNIAETSITIDGVRFIIDSGKVKEISHDPVTKMQRLREFPISRASAEQRKGRAGRTGPGVCFRLYDENAYSEFQDYSTPEIQRVSLVSIILQMLSMGLPDARRFPFLEPPSDESVENAILFLKEQGALTNDEELTPIGRMLSTLPVDVTIGKMLIMGSIFHMIEPVLTVAAAMSVQSPYTHKAHTDRDAELARRSLESEHGDPITLMHVFDAWIQAKSEGQNSRKWCKRRCLEEQRLYEIVKLRRQFHEMMVDQKLMPSKEDKDETSDQRRQKSGQRRKLGQMKRQQDKKRKKPKVLRKEDDTYIISSGDEAAAADDDIHDLELRLTQNLDHLQRLSDRSDTYSGRDVALLKLILVSGLYPQVGIADETNSYRKASDVVFHTRDKQFLLLHPTSCFQSQIDVLAPKCSDRESATDRRHKFSPRHELLSYVSLLETNKPYLITSMRIQAMQTLLLFARSLETTSDLSRILCDGWLEVQFKKSNEAEEAVSDAVYLRSTWHSLLTLRLKHKDRSVDEIANKKRETILEQLLARKLSNFLVNQYEYSLRRVLAAELQVCYVGGEYDEQTGETSGKGGVVLTDYLRYDCLVSADGTNPEGEYAALMPRTWTCAQCQEELCVTTAMRIKHQAECEGLSEETELQSREEEVRRAAMLNPMRRVWHCERCDEDFAFTGTEILKHKRTHVVETPDS